MRPTPHLGEMTIKVPAPFAGISDLGFTARYRAQQLAPVARGVDTALSRLLAIVYTAMAEGTWARLKVCRNETCRCCSKARSLRCDGWRRSCGN